MLDSLEREYKRDDDYCVLEGKSLTTNGPVSSTSITDKTGQLSQLINKHQEQKEAFLKACTHARGTARNFLKVCHRASFSYQFTDAGLMSPEPKVKGERKDNSSYVL